jgi:hypothetical protein
MTINTYRNYGPPRNIDFIYIYRPLETSRPNFAKCYETSRITGWKIHGITWLINHLHPLTMENCDSWNDPSITLKKWYIIITLWVEWSTYNHPIHNLKFMAYSWHGSPWPPRRASRGTCPHWRKAPHRPRQGNSPEIPPQWRVGRVGVSHALSHFGSEPMMALRPLSSCRKEYSCHETWPILDPLHFF